MICSHQGRRVGSKLFQIHFVGLYLANEIRHEVLAGRG
jgi:hypothetical protein